MGIAPKFDTCSAMTAPRQQISLRRNRSLPRCRIRLPRVRLLAHAKTKLTIRPPGLEQAKMRKEQRDERDRSLRRQLRHGRALLVLRAEADVRSSPRCAGGVSFALAAGTSRRPTRLLQDGDAAFSDRLPRHSSIEFRIVYDDGRVQWLHTERRAIVREDDSKDVVRIVGFALEIGAPARLPRAALTDASCRQRSPRGGKGKWQGRRKN